MIEWSFATHFLLPVSLGLLGFIEPCAIGSHMVVLGVLAGQSKGRRIASLLLFAATRTVALGIVGVIVALIGQQFAVGQKTFWLFFGVAYVLLGALYFAGKGSALLQGIGSGHRLQQSRRGAVALGVLFGLNVPACAAPLLFAVAASAAGADAYTVGFSTAARDRARAEALAGARSNAPCATLGATLCWRAPGRGGLVVDLVRTVRQSG